MLSEVYQANKFILNFHFFFYETRYVPKENTKMNPPNKNPLRWENFLLEPFSEKNVAVDGRYPPPIW